MVPCPPTQLLLKRRSILCNTLWLKSVASGLAQGWPRPVLMRCCPSSPIWLKSLSHYRRRSALRFLTVAVVGDALRDELTGEADAADEGCRCHHRISDRQQNPVRVWPLWPRQCRNIGFALPGARPHCTSVAAARAGRCAHGGRVLPRPP